MPYPPYARASLDAARTLPQLHSAAQRVGLTDALNAAAILPDDAKHAPLKRSLLQLLGNRAVTLRELLAPGPAQNRVENLLRFERGLLLDACRAQLIAQLDSPLAPPPVAAPAKPKLALVPGTPAQIPTAAQLERWAEENSVSELLETQLRRIPLPPQLNTTIDSIGWMSTHDLFEQGPHLRMVRARLGSGRLETLQQTVWGTLQAEVQTRREMARARSVAELNTPLPEGAVLRGVVTAVRKERDRLRVLHPRTRVGAPGRCTVQEDPTALVLPDADSRGMHVLVGSWASGVAMARHGGSMGLVHDCETELLALEDALTVLWLRPVQPVVTRLLEVLTTPDWARALKLLTETNQKFDARLELQEELRLCWRVHAEDNGDAMVTLLVQKATKKGTWSAGSVIRPRDVNNTFHAALLPAERRAANLLAGADYISMVPRNLLHAQALELLVGNPRVVLEGPARMPLEIQVADVGFRVVAREDGTYAMVPTTEDGTLVNPEHIPSVGVPPGEPARFCVMEGAVLTVVRASPRVRALLDVMRTRAPRFPQEALPDLLGFAAGVGEHVTVSLPEELRGEELPDAQQLVVRLNPLTQGALHVEVLCLPLAGHSAHPPGQGPMEVHALKDNRRVYVRRNPVSELERAHALALSLGLPAGGEEQDFVYDVTSGDDALDLVATLADRAGPQLTVEWPARAFQVTRRATSKDLRVEVGKRKDWFGIQGILEVDGAKVELAVLLDALRHKRRYVEVSPDRFVALDQQLRSQLQPLAAGVSGTDRSLTLGPGAALALDALAQQLGGLKVDDGYQKFTERVRAAANWQPELPKVASGVLRDYQADGVRWLARLAAWGAGACLADDMGLGKTLQALMLLAMRQKDGPALVVAPTSVCRNWLDEARRFTPSLKPLLYREIPAAERAETLAELKAGQVLVISYGLLVQDAELLKTRVFATLVLDEAQAIKNPSTRRAMASRGLEADFKVALTGTPMENHLGELWSLLRTVFPPLLGSQEEFRERFAAPIERNADSDRRAALALLIRPFLLRRTKSQVALELPSRTEVSMAVQLSAPERALYEQSRLAAAAHLSGLAPETESKQRFEVLAALTRLRLCACHPRLYDAQSTLSSSKVTRLIELLQELRAAGHKALVFSQFTSLLALVRTELEKEHIPYALLEGQTPPEKRDSLVSQFQSGQGGDVFLISLRAGGMGLNLTAATYVIHLDPWWNPAVEDQASDRAHRIGQTRPVTIIRMVAQGTVEEQILSMHQDKRALVASILDGTETAGRLSTADLITLIQGSAEGSDEDVDVPSATVVPIRPVPTTTAPVSTPAPVPSTPQKVAPPPAVKEGAIPGWLGGNAAGWSALLERFSASLVEDVEQGRLASMVSVGSYRRAATRFGEWLRAASEKGHAFPADPAELATHYMKGLKQGTIDAPKSEATIARPALTRLIAFAAPQASQARET